MKDVWDENGRFPITNYFNLLPNITDNSCEFLSNPVDYGQNKHAIRRLGDPQKKFCDARLTTRQKKCCIAETKTGIRAFPALRRHFPIRAVLELQLGNAA
jgi:hypothetical protein